MVRVDHARRKAGRSRPGTTGAATAAAIVLFFFSLPALAVEPCATAVARVVSMQGSVERRIAEDRWSALAAEATLCAGDTAPANRLSRVALLLANQTTLRLDENTTLTLTPVGEREGTLIRMLRGGLLVLTRTPKPLTVTTPFVNPSVEGTEFSLRVLDDSATISVFEGRVIASNGEGSVKVGNGEAATAARGGAPGTTLLVRPVDAVNWTLYVPMLFDEQPADQASVASAAQQARQRSAALYRSGRLDEALAALDTAPDAAGLPRHLAARAGLLLLGRMADTKLRSNI